MILFLKRVKRTFANRVFILNWIVKYVFSQNARFPHSVHYTSLVKGGENIEFNKNDQSIIYSFAVSGGCYFMIGEGSKLIIGDGTIWAWNLNLQTANHDLKDRSKYNAKDIIIGKNCWIGGNVSIIAGAKLGDNVVVGANSVVNKEFPSNVVIAGCPAKIIKYLD